MVMSTTKFTAYAILALALFCISGCDITGEWDYKEIERVKSPDGVVDAILVEGNGGATTSLTFLALIVPSGMKFDQDNALSNPRQALFYTYTLKDFKLVWIKPKLLEIRHRKDATSNSSQLWHSPKIQNDGYVVEVQLVPLGEELLESGH